MSKKYIKNIKSGRKLNPDEENPIDNMMIMVVDKLAPIFKKMNYTPNGITTLSAIFSGVGLYHLYNHELIPFTIYILLAHLCDDMDGYYARIYNMVTDSGDAYDHLKDLVVGICYVYIFYTQYNILNFPVLIVILCCMLLLGAMFVGCQESLVSEENKSSSLSIFKALGPKKSNCKQYIGYLRYFGPGTLIIILILVAWYLESESKCLAYDPMIGYNNEYGEYVDNYNNYENYPVNDFAGNDFAGNGLNDNQNMIWYQQPIYGYRFNKQ